MEEKLDKAKREEAETNKVLGLFLIFFGLVLLFSLFFTPTVAGRVINLAAGFLLLLIGGIMIYLGRKKLNQMSESSS